MLFVVVASIVARRFAGWMGQSAIEGDGVKRLADRTRSRIQRTAGAQEVLITVFRIADVLRCRTVDRTNTDFDVCQCGFAEN